MISVIVCTYNRRERIRVALAALIKQDMPAEGMEIVVVDNGSNDGTKHLIYDLRHSCSNLRYVVEPKLGLSTARNTGITHACGDILAFTDDDAVVQEGWVCAVSDVMRDQRYYGGGGKIVPIWSTKPPEWFISRGPYAMHGAGSIVWLDLGNKTKVFTPDDCFAIPEFSMARALPVGANMWYRHTVYEKGIAFDSSRGPVGRRIAYGDDFVFGKEVERKFGPLVYCPNAVVHHPVHVERLTKNFFRESYHALGFFYADYIPDKAKWSLIYKIIKHIIGILSTLCFKPSIAFFHELELRFVISYLSKCFLKNWRTIFQESSD